MKIIRNTVLVQLINGRHILTANSDFVVADNITIRDTDKQQQNVDDLSRDTDHANGSIGPIFDKEKEQNRLREAQLIGEIGGQVSDIVRTQGQIAAEKALKDPDAIQAAKEALAGASAPYLAEVVKNMTADPVTGKTNVAANAMAHAVLGAVTAYASGSHALSGAAGAVTAELMAPAIIAAMGWDLNNLSEDQKQTVSALTTLALSGSVAVTGGSSTNLCMSQDRLHNNYDSVQEQTGILRAKEVFSHEEA